MQLKKNNLRLTFCQTTHNWSGLFPNHHGPLLPRVLLISTTPANKTRSDPMFGAAILLSFGNYYNW